MVEMSTQFPVPWHGPPIEPLDELLMPLLVVVLLDEALDELDALPPAPVLPLAVLLELLLFVPPEPPEPPLPEVDP